jgi:hypothetical protein
VDGECRWIFTQGGGPALYGMRARRRDKGPWRLERKARSHRPQS